MITTKLAALRNRLDAGDDIGALRIAAKFPRLGADQAVIMRGWEAHCRPDNYRQMGQDPSAHVAAGCAAVRRRYSGAAANA